MVVEDDDKRVVDVDGDAVMESNSLQKLFTAGAALLELGPAFRYRTVVRADGEDLVFVASGDPTFDAGTLAQLCKGVAASGVRRVRCVFLDDSRYDRLRAVPAWKDYYVPGFTGPLSAFVLDRNRYRRDDEFVADPVAAHGPRVVDALRAAGVEVTGECRVGGPAGPGSTAMVAEHVSAPLAEIVRAIVCESDTFTAELLVKELGGGTTADGVRVVDEVAARLGVPRAAQAAAADGSGLAPATSDTAARVVAWLRAMERSPVAEAFLACLPVAAESGTLAGRFHGTAAAGAVAAKTGTRRLHGTANLAGYATASSGRRLRFALTVTRAPSQPAAVAAVDAALVSIVEHW